MPKAETSGFVRIPIGLCEDYPEESRSLDEVRRDIALLKEAGVSVLRVSIGWDGVEPSRDRYDLAFWDAFVGEMTAAAIRIIPYVAYTPRWASRDAGPDHWRHPPVDVGEFEQVMGLLAGRFRGRVGSWEIWNEPDNADYWRGTEQEFAALLVAGARAVRAADPTARVVFGGVAGHPEFAVRVLARPEVSAVVDTVNAHAYFETWDGRPIEALPSYVAAFAPALARVGGRRDLWLAEVGYGSYRRGEIVSPAYRARFAHEHTLGFQAVALLRTLTLGLSLPEVSLFAWYEVKDAPPGAPVIGDENNRHLGVTFSDWRPKPALAALRLAVRLFGEGFRRLDDALVVERPPGSRAQVHAFVTPARRALLVAWLPTTDERAAERISVELPLRPAGPAWLLDAQGGGRERLREPTTTPSSGTVRLSDLEIRRDDLTLIEIPVFTDRS